MAKSEIDKTAEDIISTHDGRAMFTLGQTAKIIGASKNTIADYLYQSGIHVKKVGQKKMVTARQIAEFMCTGRVAAIDNTSRAIAKY